jgi:hypothetical protein
MELIYTDFNGNTERLNNVRYAHLTSHGKKEDACISIKDNIEQIEIYGLQGKIDKLTTVVLSGY